MHTITCCTCGTVFHCSHKRRYCTENCRPSKQTTTICALPRECGVCGKSFTPNSAAWRAKYCSSHCGDRAVRREANCRHCGKSFGSYQSKELKYCSRECFKAAQGKRAKYYALHVRRCKTCNVYISSKGAARNVCGHCANVRSSGAPSKARACGGCGVLFSPMAYTVSGRSPCQPRPRYCSDECEESAKSNKRRSARKAYRKRSRARGMGAGRNHRKRARLAGVEYEAVQPRKVFDRDGWRCQICGISTPAKCRGTHKKNAPELDHVIPIALGGPHTYGNVQCACRQCNGKKGASRVMSQAALFPVSSMPGPL